MADMKIDDATRDSQVTGAELLPASDGGEPKAVSTEKIKDYVLAQIAALAAATGVDAGADKVYILKGGALKPVAAATLAAAVLDVAYTLTQIATINGNETIAVKDGNSGRKTATLTQLKTWITDGLATATALSTLTATVNGKVDKVEGKGLSKNDYTDVDKAKLDGLMGNAQANWSQTDSTAADFIKNKPTIPTEMTVDSTLDTTSTNPIENGAVATAIDTIEDALDDRPTDTEVAAALAGKVDKVTGKALSKNDFTDALKTKLEGLQSGAAEFFYSELNEDVSPTQFYPYNLSTLPNGCVGILYNAPTSSQYGKVEAVLPTGAMYWLEFASDPEWTSPNDTPLLLDEGYYYTVRRMDIGGVPNFLFMQKLPNNIE